MIIKKDKITKQVAKAIKKIEKEEVTFEDKQKLLLNKYKEIYKSNDLTFEDLIKRKVHLKKSREKFELVFLTVMLSGTVTFLINIIYELDINWFINFGEWVYFIYFIIFVIFGVLIYIIIKAILIDRDVEFEKYYNAEKFEIELIDTIIEREFTIVDFDCIKNEIINSCFNEDEN